LYSKCEAQLRYIQEVEAKVARSVTREEWDKLRSLADNRE
jgi:hypothetical protein